MKIAVASLGDPRSVKTWSGIPAHIIPALEKRGHEVVAIALHKPAEPWYYNWLRRFYYRLQKKWFLSSVEKKILQRIGQQFDDAVANSRPDIVISIHGDFLAYTTFTQPSVIVHDATFACLVDYYPEFSNLTQRSISAGNAMYQLASKKATAAVFSATWASKSAMHDYSMEKDKVYTVPFGANLDLIPTNKQVEQWINERSLASTCNLLFLGINWKRKGGVEALHFVKTLNLLGVKAKLIIVGCSPMIDKADEQYVEELGFLKKSVFEERQRLESLLQHSHALILPSIAECYGCVYCEANAYGLPALGRDTGGVSEIIRNDINGLLWKRNESLESFANRWKKIWQSRKNYIELSATSRNEYDTRLNYNVFVSKLEDIITTNILVDKTLNTK